MLSVIEIYHQICDISRLLEHFSDLKSVKFWPQTTNSLKTESPLFPGRRFSRKWGGNELKPCQALSKLVPKPVTSVSWSLGSFGRRPRRSRTLWGRPPRSSRATTRSKKVILAEIKPLHIDYWLIYIYILQSLHPWSWITGSGLSLTSSCSAFMSSQPSPTRRRRPSATSPATASTTHSSTYETPRAFIMGWRGGGENVRVRCDISRLRNYGNRFGELCISNLISSTNGKICS